MPPAVSRRSFLTTAGTATFAATLATTATFTARSYARVIGANDRIGVGVIGGGVIGTAHLNVIKNLREKNNLLPVAVADCWKTRADKGKELVGAEHSLTDYRRLLDMKEIAETLGQYVLVTSRRT